MLEKIKEIAADSLGADVSTMTAETSFKEDLGADGTGGRVWGRDSYWRSWEY